MKAHTYALLFAGSRLFRLSCLDSSPVLPLEEISESTVGKP